MPNTGQAAGRASSSRSPIATQSHKKRKPSIETSSPTQISGGAACKAREKTGLPTEATPTTLNSASDNSTINPAKRVKSRDFFPKTTAAYSGSTNPMLASSSPQTHSNDVVDLTTGSSNDKGKGKAVVRGQPSALPPRNGVKKIVVKNFRQQAAGVPDEWIKKTWDTLDAALKSIFDNKRPETSTQELYKGCENLCRAGKAPMIYERLRARLTDYVSGTLRENILNQPTQLDEDLVGVIEAAWRRWQERLGEIKLIFFYFNQAYLYPSADKLQIWDLGLQLFSQYVVADGKFRPRFLNGVFKLYEGERKGEADPEKSNLLMASMRILSSLGLYATIFEDRFVDVSEGFYSSLAERLTEEDDVARYARECAAQIEKEVFRIEKYHLESSTRTAIIGVIEKEMIKLHVTDLLYEPGVRELIKDNDTESLRTLYQVLARVEDAGQRLRPLWSKYIKDQGTTIVTDLDRESEMVIRLLDLKSSLESILKASFSKNQDLTHAMRESFETFINEQRKGFGYKNNSKPSEMIAKHMDLLLRTGIKSIAAGAGAEGEEPKSMGDEDAQLSDQLDRALDLFRFIHGKDVFEAFYKKDLARRLLLGRSASADAEKAMLSKLKTECGSGFTMNLEIMFKDIDISKENMTSFKSSKSATNRPSGMDLSVTVLSQAAWPTYPETTITMPSNVALHLEAYHQYYTSKHKGRKLAWRHALAHSIIRANFPEGKKELSMSAFQAVVLLLFNDEGKPLSYEYIKTATTLNDAELIRTLQSLACAKYRPLTKHPKGKDVKSTDTFSVNLGFADPKFRIKINQIQLKETKEENTATHEQITQDRQYETQAAIIRIMKSRKTIGHNELITETINQTKKRGVLDMADIKKNIERLIDKDYMERSENNTYTYVA